MSNSTLYPGMIERSAEPRRRIIPLELADPPDAAPNISLEDRRVSVERRLDDGSDPAHHNMSWTKVGLLLIAAGTLLLWWDTPAPHAPDTRVVKPSWGLPVAMYQWVGYHRTPIHE